MKGYESMNIAGALRIQKKTPDNTVIEEVRVNNSITLAGRDLVASLFNMKSPIEDMKRVTKMCLGTGPDSGEDRFAPHDTALKKKIGETPIKSIDDMQVTDKDGTPRKMLRITGELKEDECNGALKEAGLFTDDDRMYNRVIFAPINKSDKFKLTLIWEITF